MSDVRLDDDRLAAVLASVGEHLVVDRSTAATAIAAQPSQRRRTAVAPAIARRGRGPRRRRRGGRWPSPRPAGSSAGGWASGASRCEIDRSADPTGLPSFTAPAVPIDAGSGRRRPRPADAGDRRQRSSGRRAAGGRCRRAACSPAGPTATTTLWIVETGGGDELLKKVAAGADDVTELRDLGDGGVAITGAHLLQTPHRRVGADNVVIWTDGELTLRLDGAADIDDARRDRPPARRLICGRAVSVAAMGRPRGTYSIVALRSGNR